MNQKTSVLIVDDNVEITQKLTSYINAKKDMTVVATAHDGIEALISIQKYKPDIMVLDLFMPKMDGLDLLMKLDTMSLIKTPKIILTSVTEKEIALVSSMVDIKIDSYILKPLNCRDMCNIIRHVIAHDNIDGGYNESNLESLVTQYLIELGIPANTHGYHYCRCAIIMVIKDAKFLKNITKKLYPQIANIYDTTSSCVERAIRYSVEVAWERGNPNLIKRFFKDDNKPTNSEFIVFIAEQVKLILERDKL